ncbi:MAG: phosphoribosyltransferase [Planctomycetota bacterium]|jgi:predicted phosphoribosyltransferase
MFRDRKDAGRKLGRALEEYKNCDGLVLGIPRGGMEVGYYVAEHLEIPLSLVVVRKLPLPENPEAGFGAIAEDGSTYFVDRVAETLSPQVSQAIQSEQKREVERRIEILREGRPLPEIEGRIVILVDDGIAMGSTMQAAVMLCRNRKAKKVVAASPVAGPSVAMDLARVVDQTVILEEPVFFYAVAQVYQNWYDVPDSEVVEIMQKSRQLELHSHQR